MFLERKDIKSFLKSDKGKGLLLLEQLQKGNVYKIVGICYRKDEKFSRPYIVSFSAYSFGLIHEGCEEHIEDETKRVRSTDIPILVLSNPEIVESCNEQSEPVEAIGINLFLFELGEKVYEVLKDDESIILFKEVK